MMKLSPKVLTGALNPSNKGACDWGWQGFLAHGCQTFIVIIDPKTVQVLQVLDGHKVPVTKLKWSHENYHHDQGSPYTLRLASADLNGVIISWDVAQADKKAEFSDGNRPVQDLSWVGGHDGCRDLLVALHPPYSLILWNADTGTKLWKKSYTETLISFTFDPFDPRQLAFLGQDCIVFVDDFAVTKLPSSNGNKFYISSPSSQGGSIPQSHSSSQLSDKRVASLNLAKRMSRILVGDTRPNNNRSEDEPVVANECLQLTYHPACRHHLILLYAREVLILDLAINQTVGIIPMERTGSPFVQVLPCMQRDVVICLHENGSLSLRVRRKTNIITTPASEGSGAFDDTPPHVSLDVAYDLRGQSDAMRLTRHSKVFGVSICAVSERSVSLVMSDSRVIFWDVRLTELPTSQNQLSPLYTPGHSDTSANQNIPPALPGCKLPIISNVKYPRLTLSDFISQSAERQINKGKPHGVCLKFLLTGLISGISGAVTVIRMCPPLTTKNWSVYQPLLALGTQTGCIQIYNVSSGQLEKEYSIHSSAIRGIEWVTLQSLLTFAYPNPGTSGLVKNEVVLLDVVSGKVTPLRGHKDEESPVELIRVSCLKQYFMVCFKDKPFELWDLQSLTLMREMPKHLPRITALEWSPSHALKTLKRRLLQRHDTSGQHAGDAPGGPVTTPPAVTDPSGREGKSHQKSSPKEHFIFTDQEGVVYHVIVEGNLITDCSKIPPEPGMSTINSIAWKGDFILYGDVDGHLNIWDLKSKKSKYLQTHRGWVKKVRFAPGRGNMKFLVLYNSGLDVWDAGEVQCLYSLKYPKDICKVIDAEWAASDKPVVATEDGCVRVMDIKLVKASAPVDERLLGEDIFCPHLLPPKASLSLKYLLSHQPWNEKFQLKLDNMLDCDRDLEAVVNAQMAVLNRDISEYLPHCVFGTAHRCLMVARLFGDEADLHFWTVALHYLRSERHSPMSKSSSRVSQSDTSLFIPTTPVLESTDLVKLDPATPTESVSSVFTDQPLDRCYDVLCDHKSFQKYQLDRLALHDSKRATYEHTKKCAENCMLLGQTDRAVQLLLETEPENDGYYIDSLRACLVASIRSSGASQSTIKLVATNLIANGKLSEGVQLLCLIDKGLDACRYLQTYGEWQQAAWLAKATLDYTEYSEVMKRWADHLCSSHANQKSKALLALLSLGQFVKVIEMLYTMRHFDTATCFVEACLEFGLLDVNEETKRLIDAVYLEYARYLTNLGNRKASEYYCHLAGDSGRQFLKEIEILFS